MHLLHYPRHMCVRQFGCLLACTDRLLRSMAVRYDLYALHPPRKQPPNLRPKRERKLDASPWTSHLSWLIVCLTGSTSPQTNLENVGAVTIVIHCFCFCVTFNVACWRPHQHLYLDCLLYLGELPRTLVLMVWWTVVELLETCTNCPMMPVF